MNTYTSCIRLLCAFRRDRIVPRGQYMGYKLSENMLNRILGEALGVPGRSLGGLQLERSSLGALGSLWVVLGALLGPWGGQWAMVAFE